MYTEVACVIVHSNEVNTVKTEKNKCANNSRRNAY